MHQQRSNSSSTKKNHGKAVSQQENDISPEIKLELERIQIAVMKKQAVRKPRVAVQ